MIVTVPIDALVTGAMLLIVFVVVMWWAKRNKEAKE